MGKAKAGYQEAGRAKQKADIAKAFRPHSLAAATLGRYKAEE